MTHRLGRSIVLWMTAVMVMAVLVAFFRHLVVIRDGGRFAWTRDTTIPSGYAWIIANDTRFGFLRHRIFLPAGTTATIRARATDNLDATPRVIVSVNGKELDGRPFLVEQDQHYDIIVQIVDGAGNKAIPLKCSVIEGAPAGQPFQAVVESRSERQEPDGSTLLDVSILALIEPDSGLPLHNVHVTLWDAEAMPLPSPERPRGIERLTGSEGESGFVRIEVSLPVTRHVLNELSEVEVALAGERIWNASMPAFPIADSVAFLKRVSGPRAMVEH